MIQNSTENEIFVCTLCIKKNILLNEYYIKSDHIFNKANILNLLDDDSWHYISNNEHLYLNMRMQIEQSYLYSQIEQYYLYWQNDECRYLFKFDLRNGEILRDNKIHMPFWGALKRCVQARLTLLFKYSQKIYIHFNNF